MRYKNTPAYSWLSGPGLIYALRGRLRVSVGRLTAWKYRDSHKDIKRRDGPANGLCGGFVFWPLPCPAGHGRKNSRLRAVGRRTSGGKQREDIGGHGQNKTRPRKAQGGRWWYSRFFRRLPDDHQGKHKDK